MGEKSEYRTICSEEEEPLEYATSSCLQARPPEEAHAALSDNARARPPTDPTDRAVCSSKAPSPQIATRNGPRGGLRRDESWDCLSLPPRCRTDADRTSASLDSRPSGSRTTQIRNRQSS